MEKILWETKIELRVLISSLQFWVGVWLKRCYCLACVRESQNIGQGSQINAHFVITKHLPFDARSRYPLSHHYTWRVGHIGKRKTTSYAWTLREEHNHRATIWYSCPPLQSRILFWISYIHEGDKFFHNGRLFYKYSSVNYLAVIIFITFFSSTYHQFVRWNETRMEKIRFLCIFFEYVFLITITNTRFQRGIGYKSYMYKP